MSPKSAPEPCPDIIQDGDFIFCGCYNTKPTECKDHTFPYRFCPIGMDLLNLETPDQVRKRIDDGFEFIKINL